MVGRSRSAARPRAQAPASSSGAAAPEAPAPRTRRHWLRTTLLLVLAFVLVGLAPAALAARVFDLGPLSRLSLLPNAFPAPPAGRTATPPDLAVPRTAWVARETKVRGAPGGSTPLATLEPGFPVTLTAHTLAAGVQWDAVRWDGPTAVAGGRGWVPDTVLTQAGAAGPAVGDSAALAPSVAAALAPLGPNAALAVYYPSAQRLYLTNADQLYPLGDGARALLLVALFAAPSTPPLQTGSVQTGALLAQHVAQGDAASLDAAYQQIGGSAGLTTFLDDAGISGITPGSATWSDTQATPRALVQFYAALAGLTPGADLGVAASARAQALSALASDSSAVALAGLGDPLPTGASAVVVHGAAQPTAASWTICAAGILTAPSGLTYVAALCVPNQVSQAAGLNALSPVFAALASVARG